MGATEMSVPSGPFNAMRLGLGLYGRARSVFIWQAAILILISLGLVALIGVVAAGALFAYLHGKPPTPAIMAKLMAARGARGLLLVAFFPIGMLSSVLEIGLMRGFAQVMAGQRVRVSGLFWGFTRGEVWLLAFVVQLILVCVQGINVYVMGPGIQATGNPARPFAAAHGNPHGLAWLALIAVSIILNDILTLAMAMAARTLPAFSSLRGALKAFKGGLRRYLFLGLAWFLVWLVVAVAWFIVVFVAALIVAGVTGLFGAIGHVVGISIIIVGSVAAFMALLFAMILVPPASYVAASSALQS